MQKSSFISFKNYSRMYLGLILLKNNTIRLLRGGGVPFSSKLINLSLEFIVRLLLFAMQDVLLFCIL